MIIWKEVPGFPNYEVSNDGKVRRADTKTELTQSDINGYRFVSMGKSMAVHRLVVSAFIGPIPKGMHVNHKNRKRADNRRRNLEIVTPSFNARHAFRLTHHRVKHRIALLPASKFLGISSESLNHLIARDAIPCRRVPLPGTYTQVASFRPDHLQIVKDWLVRNRTGKDFVHKFEKNPPVFPK